MSKILKEFKEEILKSGKSVAEISRLSGVSASSIFTWLKEDILPTLTNAEKVLNSLGLEFVIFPQE